jgi:hypothetical protein
VSKTTALAVKLKGRVTGEGFGSILVPYKRVPVARGAHEKVGTGIVPPITIPPFAGTAGVTQVITPLFTITGFVEEPVLLHPFWAVMLRTPSFAITGLFGGPEMVIPDEGPDVARLITPLFEITRLFGVPEMVIPDESGVVTEITPELTRT